MSDPIRVAILGFSAFERNAMSSYFQLSARRLPSYQSVLDADSARFIVADADQPGVVSLLRTLGRTADAVFIGAHGPADAAAWMMRPINPAHVVRELDALVVQRDNPSSGPLPLQLPHSIPGALSDPMPLRPRDGGPATPGRRADDLNRDSEAGALLRRDLAEARRRQRAAALRPQVLRRALLVDDSEIALHFLRRQLELYGVDTDFARHSDRALDLLGEHRYGLVFIDVDLGEYSTVDGLALCHAVRHRVNWPGGQLPLLVLVSAFHDPVDQVRGTLAGADAYLGKPLDFGALDRLLQRQGLNRLGASPASGGPGAQPRG